MWYTIDGNPVVHIQGNSLVHYEGNWVVHIDGNPTADVYDPKGTVKVIPKSHGDNLVLETAWIGRAKYLVTGDKQHLLPLKVFRNIKIIEPGYFVSILRI